MKHLQEKLSEIAGTEIEITIRGEKKFTLSYDFVDQKISKKLCEFFKDYNPRLSEEEEIGTFIYINA